MLSAALLVGSHSSLLSKHLKEEALYSSLVNYRARLLVGSLVQWATHGYESAKVILRGNHVECNAWTKTHWDEHMQL